MRNITSSLAQMKLHEKFLLIYVIASLANTAIGLWVVLK